MVVKVSSKHQVTIPKDIAKAFHLRKGDVLEVERQGNKIIMIPKEVILEDKYPREDLEATEKVLSKGLPKEEISFKSGSDMTRFLKKRIKK
ncbi:MAG: AbrB/MazE/SpoVT family DNA-binding domain-containing protein [Candidatus Omnitrophica bacterium]|nr:AbrB/MazE/SpoVT family DNA-binding domain-containing protein [Candidatus Omnitrophota bacterium]MCK5592197.1 AbrB/MazE/SpoVT family DNA-binding domain-containing protein [Candidatus Paceibacterota bacterium]